MKRFSKILALTLALFMILPAAVSAGANPDTIIGSINYGVGNFVVMANDNYFGIFPGNSTDDGFGTSNPLGLARMGAAWQSGMQSLPLFEMLAYDRTTGAFNVGKLISLDPATEEKVLKYTLPDGKYGFEYDPDKRKAEDAFYAHPSEKYSPVVSFTAPSDGVYTWSLTFKRDYVASSAPDPNHPLTNELNGTQLRFYKNTEQIRRFVVNDASARNLTVTATLNRGDVVYLEFDPIHNNISADGFTVSNLKVFLDQHYTGRLDIEYDNTNQKPLQSFAFMSDLHTDEDIMLNKDEPVYGTVTNAYKFLAERGNIDAIFYAGDLISDNAHHDNKPAYKYADWTTENIDWTLSHIFNEGKKATEGGKGKIFAIAGNHDKDAGYVASYDKTTGAYMGNENDIFFTDYYTRYTSKDTLSGEAMKVLKYNDMWKYEEGGKEGDYNSYYNEVLCYRYNVGGIEVIGVSQARCNNPAYASDPQLSHHNCQGIYTAQGKWVVEQLEEIGKDKTVIVMAHYHMSDMGTAGNIMTDAFEEYTNVIYVYGHVHHGGDQTEAWFNTAERIQTLGDRVQLSDGSYATNGWHYAYIGGMWNTEWNKSYAQDSTTAQITTMDFYNDHITIQTHNVGTDYVGNKTLTTYTIKREMRELEGYSGNGSGDVSVPNTNNYAENQKYVPLTVNSLKKTYTMDLGINKLEHGAFKLTAIYDPTYAKLKLSEKATVTTWSPDFVEHTVNGMGLVMNTQRADWNAKFDMRAEAGYSSAMVFTAPNAGAYGYSVDLGKASMNGGKVTVKVMKGSAIIQELLPNSITSSFKVEGHVYLEEGEDLRVVISKYDYDSRTGGNEVAVMGFVVKEYGKYTMPASASGDGDSSGCQHRGGLATCVNKAVCTKCGEPYGDYNKENHESTTQVHVTDATHRIVYTCCGLEVVPEGKHTFLNSKCTICSFVCDHEGYMKGNQCLNCDPSEAGIVAPNPGYVATEKPKDTTDPDNTTPEDTTAPEETTVPDIGGENDSEEQPILLYVIVAAASVLVAGIVAFIVIKKFSKKKV